VQHNWDYWEEPWRGTERAWSSSFYLREVAQIVFKFEARLNPAWVRSQQAQAAHAFLQFIRRLLFWLSKFSKARRWGIKRNAKGWRMSNEGADILGATRRKRRGREDERKREEGLGFRVNGFFGVEEGGA
jgi:hypothetical protein